MKFMHTADWQIGMRAAHVGAAGERVREARLASGRAVVEEARARGADFILVAGDTFEDNGVDRVLVQKVADILGGSTVPVYVIPGNHDPLVPGSVWDHPAWGEHRTVRVLREAGPVEAPGGILYPCPALEKHARKDPTAWIRAHDAQGIRVGLAHGTVEGMPQMEPEHPVPRDAGLRAGLDYLALGHWHSTALYEDARGPARMAYSGTHETTRFGERDSGNVLLVEIAAPGAPPTVTPVRTGRLEWVTLTRELAQEGGLAGVRAGLDKLTEPQRTLIEVRLSGVLAGSDRGELERLGEVLESRFLYNRLDTGGLHPAPEDEAWLEELPPGVLREAALRLRELANPGRTGTADPAQSPKIAARALLDLYALARGTER